MTRTEALDFGTRASLKSSCWELNPSVVTQRSCGEVPKWGLNPAHGTLLSSQERGLTLNCSLASMSS